MQRGPDCLSGSQTTAGLVSLDAFARSKDATPSPPRSSHFHPWWCTPPVLLGCLQPVGAAALRAHGQDGCCDECIRGERTALRQAVSPNGAGPSLTASLAV